MIDSAIQNQIKSELTAIEKDEQVTVLYACESGSRAWGFESQDSDYDVRFIYLRKTEWYLTLNPGRDVIERPISDDLDIAGWDFPKAMQLMRKSNPPLLEWLQSPVVYHETFDFRDRIRAEADHCFSPIACMYHYRRMAENNYKKYLLKDRVNLKKYFYVLRPVMACLWIERGYGVVPILFQSLVDRVIDAPELRRSIIDLIEIKKSGSEMDDSEKHPVIQPFLESELARLDASLQSPADPLPEERLDKLFRDFLQKVNGTRW